MRPPNIIAGRKRDLGEFLIKAAATGLGLGYMPLIPGTFGTLLGIPVCLLLSVGGRIVYVSGTIILSAAGIWVADRADRLFEVHDSRKIVIDEICGFLVTMAFVPLSLLTVGAGFFLFRLFDIVKPFPVGWCDRNVQGGLGVMSDDLLAGIYANLSLWVFLGVRELAYRGIQ